MSLNRQQLELLLESSIAFRPLFGRIAGGALPGLFLSQCWYWSQRTSDPSGWFWKTIEEWQRETCMTRGEQETARRKLVELGLLEEERRGDHGRLHFRLDIERLLDLIAETSKGDCGNPQTRLQKSTNAFAETDKGDCRNPQTPLQNPANTYMYARADSEITTKTTPETTPENIAASPSMIPRVAAREANRRYDGREREAEPTLAFESGVGPDPPVVPVTPKAKTPKPDKDENAKALLKAIRTVLYPLQPEWSASDWKAYAENMRVLAEDGATPIQVAAATRRALHGEANYRKWERHMVNPRSIQRNFSKLSDALPEVSSGPASAGVPMPEEPQGSATLAYEADLLSRLNGVMPHNQATR